MALFEITIALLLAGALLSALARRVGAPYPAFLALAGAGIALLPGAPVLTLSPELVLTLFVAPILLDAAYDASPRDIRDNWLPIGSNAVVVVLLTVLAVATCARLLRPGMPWPVALTLGAIVAPPDAAAATAVLRALRPPHRVLVILEGESLLNDATALLVYRAALAAAVGSWSGWGDVPLLGLAIAGGAALGGALGWLQPRILPRFTDGPTSVIVQFVSTFAVWMLATRLGLSAIITLLCYAMTIAQFAPRPMDARLRIQSYAVWDVAVFVLNVLAFILAGLQLRSILLAMRGADWRDDGLFGAATLGVVVAVRIAWVMGYNTIVRWKNRRFGARQRRTMMLPTAGTGVLIAWCGMRGVVTLATALALPERFPFRSLILLAAFAVVLGTLIVQGLTLRPLMALLELPNDDQVEREVQHARARAAEAALASLGTSGGATASALREEYDRRRSDATEPMQDADDREQRIGALEAERRTIRALRASGEIGDDAYHIIEEELDWAEMYSERRLGRS